MPSEKRTISGVASIMTMGLVKKFELGETQRLVERDTKYDLIAFSDPNVVATLVTHNWVRDWRTGARLQELPDLRLRHIWEREVDCNMYHQRFVVLMWSLAAVKPKEFDSKKVAWLKYRLRHCGHLGWDYAERRDRMKELYDKAFQYEVERRYALAFGRPVEGEKFGKGAVLSRMEVTSERGKGGLIEHRTNLGSVKLTR